jgi:uncharacterized protein
MDSQSPASASLVGLAILFEGGLGLAAMAIGWLLDCPATATLRWEPTAIAWGALASLPLVVVLLALVRFPVGPLRGLNEILNDSVLPLFAHCGWLEFAIISILAGLGEELMFRGLLQAALTQWLAPTAGLIVASMLFGLAHPITAAYAVMGAIFGLYLGLVWQASGNLLVPIVTHAVYDFVALAYLMARFRRRASERA